VTINDSEKNSRSLQKSKFKKNSKPTSPVSKREMKSEIKNPKGYLLNHMNIFGDPPKDKPNKQK
jgi:hypothetical protein